MPKIPKTPIINEIISALARYPSVTKVIVSKEEQKEILWEYNSLKPCDFGDDFPDVVRGNYPSIVIYGCPVEARP